jgi:hypothetical protein
MNTARYGLGGAGTQTASLGFGGFTGPAYSAATEEYNGTTWTFSNNINTARYGLGRCRNTNSRISFWRKWPSYSR